MLAIVINTEQKAKKQTFLIEKIKVEERGERDIKFPMYLMGVE